MTLTGSEAAGTFGVLRLKRETAPQRIVRFGKAIAPHHGDFKGLGMQGDLDQAASVEIFEAGRDTPDIVPPTAAILQKS